MLQILHCCSGRASILEIFSPQTSNMNLGQIPTCLPRGESGLRSPRVYIACAPRRTTRRIHELRAVPVRHSSQFKNNHSTEMCSGSEAGSYLRFIDSCVTRLKAQGPARTCNESKEEEEFLLVSRRGTGSTVQGLRAHPTFAPCSAWCEHSHWKLINPAQPMCAVLLKIVHAWGEDSV